MNKKMMTFLMMAIAMTASSASAWQPAVVCDNGLLSVDVEPTGGPRSVKGQFVLRGPLSQWLASDVRAIQASDLNAKGELVRNTNFDERGNLNLNAALNTSGSLCLKLSSATQQLVVLEGAIGAECSGGRVVTTYNFNQCVSR